MSDPMKDLKKEIASIKKQDLTPVTTLQLGSPIPSPNSLKKRLPSILKGFETSLLTVDEDEISSIPDRYSANQYAALLKIIVDMCHAHDIKCTNGGIEDSALVMYYVSTLSEDGDKQEKVLATLSPEQKRLATQKEFEEQRESTLNTVEKLLKIYNSTPIDTVNVTWSSFPEWLLGDVAHLVKEKTGKAIISTRIEIPKEKKQRSRLLQYVRNMNLECVIWHFPFEDLKMSDLVDEDGVLTEIATDLRSINRTIF